jgi:hypothetical protein
MRNLPLALFLKGHIAIFSAASTGQSGASLPTGLGHPSHFVPNSTNPSFVRLSINKRRLANKVGDF